MTYLNNTRNQYNPIINYYRNIFYLIPAGSELLVQETSTVLVLQNQANLSCSVQ